MNAPTHEISAKIPRVEWMRLVYDLVFVKTTRLLVYDKHTKQLVPIKSKYGEVIDFDIHLGTGIALCHEDAGFTLITLKDGASHAESLPKHIECNSSTRLLADQNILVLFYGGGVVLKTDETWHPFENLANDRLNRRDYPWHLLKTKSAVYASYPFSECSSHALYKLNKTDRQWSSEKGPELIRKPRKVNDEHRYDPLICSWIYPVTGIAGTDENLWVSRGCFHLGSILGAALFNKAGQQWFMVFPNKLRREQRLLHISAMGLMPNGEPHIVIPSKGIFKVIEGKAQMFFPLPIDAKKGSFFHKLVIDKEGCNYVTVQYHNYETEDLVIIQKENRELIFYQKINLDSCVDADPIDLDELVVNRRDP